MLWLLGITRIKSSLITFFNTTFKPFAGKSITFMFHVYQLSFANEWGLCDIIYWTLQKKATLTFEYIHIFCCTNFCKCIIGPWDLFGSTCRMFAHLSRDIRLYWTTLDQVHTLYIFYSRFTANKFVYNFLRLLWPQICIRTASIVIIYKFKP